jgi:UDP-N-acetylmuramoyl-L-alanyl-D-glutamate--2,6-diaminopimelate ligase
MEVSSHAIALQRVADVHFAVGALTNVTRDHLDFHKTFEAYAAAKRHLFDLVPRAVLNADDTFGERWSHELRGRKTVVTYALHAAADMQAQDVQVHASGSTFSLDGTRFQTLLPGRFNVSNALCALGMARLLGVADADAASGLASLSRVPGRMEHVRAAGIDAIVDYAHTPDALETVLRTLRETARRRLIVVFGCGGDRDRGKRPEMGAAAARFADLTIVTSDNPRTEDPQAIIDEILPGLGNARHIVEPDRRAAIRLAIAQASDGDVVLVAGKGHENYQIAGTQVVPFDDVAELREALGGKGAPAQ